MSYDPPVMAQSAVSSEARLQALLESGVPCIVLDTEETIIAASRDLENAIHHVSGSKLQKIFNVATSSLRSGVHCLGFYENKQSLRVPVALKLLQAFKDGKLVILVVDGAPFRDAELSRADTTPYMVLRVGASGAVVHANTNTELELLQAKGGLNGQKLASIFLDEDGEKIDQALTTCKNKKIPPPFEATVRLPTSNHWQHVNVQLTPDEVYGDDIIGIIAIIRYCEVERARKQIHRIAIDPSPGDWRERLEMIMAQVRSVIDFDHAIFGIYTTDVTRYRAVAFHPKDRDIWPTRWLELPKDIRTWIEGADTCIADVNAFVEQFPELADNEVTKQYLERGIRASVTLPIITESGPVAALTLCATEVSQYQINHLQLLRDLDLVPILLRFIECIQEERANFRIKMKTILEESKSLGDAARTIVHHIREHFDWDSVALFRVNRHKEQFELVYQSYPANKADEYQICSSYTQPIDQGMLASTLKEGQLLAIDDTKGTRAKDYQYISVGHSMRSAMTIPIHLNNRIRWLLDIESSVSHAFQGPDKDSLIAIIQALEEGLLQKMLAEIKVRLMQETEQGVVLVGMEGTILDLNPVAQSLLGIDHWPTPEGTYSTQISDYAEENDTKARDILLGNSACSKRHLRIKGADGKIRAVLATRREFEVSFDLVIWFFTDLQTLKWNQDLHYLRETVADVAQQARIPLALACSITHRLERMQPHASTKELPKLARSIAAELGKTDITFERLAENLSIRKDPIRFKEPVDLIQCAQNILKDLPDNDQQHIRINLTVGAPAQVDGDAARLGFVLRSMIAHLLQNQLSDKDQIHIDISTSEAKTIIALRLEHNIQAQAIQRQPHPDNDPLYHAVQAARADTRLGLDLIQRIIAAHQGTLLVRESQQTNESELPSWHGFEIKLPMLGQPGV